MGDWNFSVGVPATYAGRIRRSVVSSLLRRHCSIGITLGDRNQRNPPVHRTVGCRRSRSSSGRTSWRRKASSVSVSLGTIAKAYYLVGDVERKRDKRE
jgi:hypothetical protein